MSKFSNSSLLESERSTDQQALKEIETLSASRAATRVNRRSVLASLGLAAGSAATLGLDGCSNDGMVATVSNTYTPSVADVLNFALNLEYLEASFYSYIATGSGLPSSLLGTGAGTITPIPQVSFSNSAVALAAQNLALDEQEHVSFLRTTIASAGFAPVPAPSINLTVKGTINSDATFLAVARQLEAVGISAYAGGAQYFTTNTAALTYAAQILDTESQHEGTLRQLCIQLGVTSPAADSMDTPPTSIAIFNTSPTTGLNPVRTTSQVLQIVYGAAGQTGVSSGGFFPAGLNGNIKTS